MQGLYNRLLDAISKGSWDIFSQLTQGGMLDYSGVRYGKVQLSNAIVSAICVDTPRDEEKIQSLLQTATEENLRTVAQLRDGIAGREKMLGFLAEHLQASRLLNTPDFITGETPIQLALEANNLQLVNKLFRKGVLPNSRVYIGNVPHCNLFMKALECPQRENRVEMLKVVAQGTADADLLSVEGKKPKEIESRLSKYLLSLAENYSKALGILVSSNGAGENIYHRAVEAGDGEACQWLNSMLLGNPVVEEAEQLCTRLNISPQSTKKILEAARSAEKSFFLKEREKLSPASVMLNASCKGSTFMEFVAHCLSKDNFTELGEKVLIRDSETNKYLPLVEACERGPESAACLEVAAAMVSHASVEVSKAFFEARPGILKGLCEFFKESDGVIRSKGLLSFLLKNDWHLCLQLIEEHAIDLVDILHEIVQDGDHQKIAEIAAWATPEIWEKENGEGRTSLGIALSDKNVRCAGEILRSLGNAVNNAPPEEKILRKAAIDRILIKVDSCSGKGVIHLVVENAPDLLPELLQLSSDRDALLAQKDVRGLSAVHYAPDLQDCYRPLCQAKFGTPIPEYTTLPQSEKEELEASVALHKEMAEGNQGALQELFADDESNVYKCVDTVGGRKSILEVAAESGRADLVKFILLEHKKLQQRATQKCAEIDGDLASRAAAEQTLQVQREVADLKNEKARIEKTQRTRSEDFRKHANATVLRVLSKSKAEDWHSGVIESANLTQDTLVASLLNSGMNPMVTAMQSGNDPVAKKIFTEASSCLNADCERYLLANRDGERLVQYGFGLSKLYDIPYSPQEGAQAVHEEFDPAAAAAAVVREEMSHLKSQVTKKFSNKDALLPYVNAITSTAGVENLKDKLAELKDGDPTLLSLSSPDGHNIGTLIAVFGGIEQWQMYAEKYAKLKAGDRSVSPATNVSAALGSPLQAAVLAKHFARGDLERRRRGVFCDYLMQEYPDNTLPTNKGGENLLHTVVRCGDMEMLESVMTHAAYEANDIITALTERNNSRKNPLELAVYMDNSAMLKAILENAVSNYGVRRASDLLLKSSLLHTAVQTNNSAMIKVIASLQKMFNISLAPDQEIFLERQRDSKDRDPFVLAVEMGNVESVEVMVEAGFKMKLEPIKQAIVGLPESFDEKKIDEFCKILGLNEAEKARLARQRLARLGETFSREYRPEKIIQDKGARVDKMQEVTELAKKEATLFRKPFFHGCGSVFSRFRRERDQSAASLGRNIQEGKLDEVVTALRMYPGIIDSPECRSDALAGILSRDDLDLAKLAIRGSNKFVKGSGGAGMLHEIITHAKESSLKTLVMECISAGYNLEETSQDALTAFQRIKQKDPNLAAELEVLLGDHGERIEAVRRNLSDVLGLVNASSKTPAVSALVKVMNSARHGYDGPVFSRIFSQISTESDGGDHSLIKRRLSLLCFLFKKVSYLGERSPDGGDNVMHMLFRTLVNAPFVSVEVTDVLDAVLSNTNFDPELLLQKNSSGVSPLDILARTKDCTRLLRNILRAYPAFREKVSFGRMLMISVCNGKAEETRLFLEEYRGSSLNMDAVDGDGVSIFECAVRNGNLAMMTLLLEYGAEINSTDDRGYTVLDKMLALAIEKGVPIKPEVISFLVKRGINLESCSDGLSTLERLSKLEARKDGKRERLVALLEKQDLSCHEYVELRALMGSQLDVDYCGIVHTAQQERQKIDAEITKGVQNALYKTGRVASFVRSISPLVAQPFRLEKSHSDATLIGAVLHVKVDVNASVDTDALFKVCNAQAVQRTSLSFEGGRSVVEVERRRDGLTNYVCKKGRVIVSAEVKVQGRRRTIDIALGSNGSVSLDHGNADREQLLSLLQKGEINFSSSKMYIDGETIETALRNPSVRRASEGARLQEAAKALKEAGASSGEGAACTSQQASIGGAPQQRSRRGESK